MVSCRWKVGLPHPKRSKGYYLSAGIDLPLKALVWEDSERKAWLTYNDPNWIAERHALGSNSASAVEAMATLMNAIAQAATSTGS